MNINVREENYNDKDIIYKAVTKAFESAKHSDGKEQDLVNRLRNSKSYIKELSLVAIKNESIVGHIMFTKAFIKSNDKEYETLVLAPLAVLPEYQSRGIGSKLINEGLKRAKNLGYKSCIVLGHERYYPRFGFKEALEFGIKAPFKVPSENFMAIELKDKILKDIKGTVVYAKEFFQ